VESPELYPFTSHTFTTCGSSGRTGPSLSACRSAYTTDWDATDAFAMTTNGIQLWTVPATGPYRIVARGSVGGRSSASLASANGALVEATLELVAGDVLQLLVGQTGAANATHGNESGGGGGTFVVNASDEPLVVAGGAGGAPSSTHGTGCSRTISSAHGQTGTSGGSSVCSSYSGVGGANGAGGTMNASGSQEGGAGGGFLTAGQTGQGHCSVAYGGASFLQGGVGGSGSGSCYSPQPHGGFGGGGSGGLGSPGGGGGYSGGAVSSLWSSYSNYGGGGGSFTAATATGVVKTAGSNGAAGSITITQL
jgi:hypothetical protein